MLDELNQIEWEELTHAYGSAEDVPGLLRDLASPDKTICDNAISDLYGNIWHQGTVYEATSYAVPFLIELLDLPAVRCKADILYLLQALATGSSYLDVHQLHDWHRNQRKTEEFQAKIKQELEGVHAARRAVLAGVPLYLDLLSHREAPIRAAAAFVLGSCVEEFEQIMPSLRTRVGDESNWQAVAAILLSMSQLHRQQVLHRDNSATDSSEELRENFGQISENHSKDPKVRFIAALCGVMISQEQEEAARFLPTLSATIHLCGEEFSEMTWTEGELALNIAAQFLTPFPPLRLKFLIELLGHDDASLRLDSIWEVASMCRERRSTAEVAVPPLAKLIADTDPKVRGRVSKTLLTMGSARFLAVDILQEFQQHPDRRVKTLAAKTLTNIRADRPQHDLQHWLGKPGWWGKGVSTLIAKLNRDENSPKKLSQQDREQAATELERIGPPAVEAVPALRMALQEDSQWMRVRAARALWKITQDSSEVLEVLLEELRCRPAGLLAADCLGQMGRHAQEAATALRRIVDSEVRLVEYGVEDEWIDEDEMFCKAAKQALAKIEEDQAASKSQ